MATPFPEPAARQREAVFHIHGISKTYRMGDVEVHALRRVDLDLYAGEFIVVLGPSGSSKSTLLNHPRLDVPTSGEVHYLDHNLLLANSKLSVKSEAWQVLVALPGCATSWSFCFT